MRVGILGAGGIAAEHVATLRQLDDVELVAVCDLDRVRAERLAGGAPTYTQWAELLTRERPDAILVCTPPLTHRELTVPALEQGIHVHLEKPIARGLEDAQAIVAAAGRSRSVCAVGYQWRGIEVLDDLREAVTGQALGLLVGINAGPAKSRPWFLDRSQGGGNLLERASHHIDLERALGGEVVAVQAAASAVLLAQSQGERGDIDDAGAISSTSRTADSAPSRSPGRARAFRRNTRSMSWEPMPFCILSSTPSSGCTDGLTDGRSRRPRDRTRGSGASAGSSRRPGRASRSGSSARRRRRPERWRSPWRVKRRCRAAGPSRSRPPNPLSWPARAQTTRSSDPRSRSGA